MSAPELRARTTAIPGLLLLDIPVHGDNRGWFKENWQRSKAVAAGLPDFGPVQNNISFNDAIGTTRLSSSVRDRLCRLAIGYQDVVSIANTTLNQTGQAIEGIAIIMLVYLTISLSISLFMNWYNARIALVER